MVNHDKRLIYSKSISWVEINDEVFVFDELNGSIHLFRRVEREIWKLIDTEVTFTIIVNSIQKNFNVNEEKTLTIIKKFQEENLVEESKENISIR